MVSQGKVFLRIMLTEVKECPLKPYAQCELGTTDLQGEECKICTPTKLSPQTLFAVYDSAIDSIAALFVTQCSQCSLVYIVSLHDWITLV